MHVSQADRIRQFAFDHYIAPALARGERAVTIRAGDVHKDMGLTSAMPAVCSALGGGKFAAMAGVVLKNRTGPANGANVYFRFGLSPAPAPVRARSPSQTTQRRSRAALGGTYAGTRSPSFARIDMRGALALVSCVKSKLPHAAPARELYTSAWFRKARDLVESSGARWFVLSSYYGLVRPAEKIAPYDYTLNWLGTADRRMWAEKTLARLLPEARKHERVVLLAGQRYWEYLVEPLERQGNRVEVPMRGLRRGEQLAWLSGHV